MIQYDRLASPESVPAAGSGTEMCRRVAGRGGERAAVACRRHRAGGSSGQPADPEGAPSVAPSPAIALVTTSRADNDVDIDIDGNVMRCLIPALRSQRSRPQARARWAPCSVLAEITLPPGLAHTSNGQDTHAHSTEDRSARELGHGVRNHVLIEPNPKHPLNKGLRRESSRVWTVVSRQSWLSWLVRCEVDVSSYCGRMAWYESDSIGVGNRPGRMVDESLLQKSIRPGVLVDESFFAKSNTPGRIG